MQLSHGPAVQALVIDDLVSLCCLPAAADPKGVSAARELHLAACDVYDRHSVLGSPEKDVYGQSLFQAIGTEVDSRPNTVRLGLVSAGASLARRAALALLSLRAARLPVTTSGLVARLTGAWTSVFLYRRPTALQTRPPLLPHESRVAIRLSRRLAQELVLCAVLSPIAAADLTAKQSQAAYATDASLARGAICKCHLPANVARSLWQNGDREKGAHTRLEEGPKVLLKTAGLPHTQEDVADSPPTADEGGAIPFGFDVLEVIAGGYTRGVLLESPCEHSLFSAPPSGEVLGAELRLCFSRSLRGSPGLGTGPGIESIATNDVLAGAAWETVSVIPWQGSSHINVLELAVIVALHRQAATCSPDSRIYVMADSQVAKSAAAKGRSASRALGYALGRSSAVQLAFGLFFSYGFAPTRLNIADDPTRFADLRPPDFCGQTLQQVLDSAFDPAERTSQLLVSYGQALFRAGNLSMAWDLAFAWLTEEGYVQRGLAADLSAFASFASCERLRDIQFTPLMRYVLNGNTYPWTLLGDLICLPTAGLCFPIRSMYTKATAPRPCMGELLCPDSAADGRAECEDATMQNAKNEPVEPVEHGKAKRVQSQPRKEPLDAISPRELESLLTRGSLCKAPGREQCDLAQVAHGVLAACKHWGQELWNKRFGVVNVGNEERGQLLSRQLHVQTCFGIVYSPSHWCLLVLHRPTASPPIAHLYDGLASAMCADSAKAFLYHAQNVGWTQPPLSLTIARVGSQPDAWSCGHRVIITANLVLAHLARSGTLPQSMDGPTSQDVEVFLAEARQQSLASGSDSSAIEAKAEVSRELDSRKPTISGASSSAELAPSFAAAATSAEVSHDIDLQSAGTYTVEAHTAAVMHHAPKRLTESRRAGARFQLRAECVTRDVSLANGGAQAVAPFPPPVPQLPAAAPGYEWRQVPVMPVQPPLPPPSTPAPIAPAVHVPQQQSTWNRQPWRGGGQQKQQGQWGQRWNKWHRSSQGSNEPRGSGHQSSWTDPDHHNIQEATPSEVAAADARKSTKEADKDEADDEESYLAALWKSAQDEARADPTRPLSARELAEQGKLQWWWKMPWKTIAEKFPDTHGYKEFLEGLEGPIPTSVISRVVTVLAAFRSYGRSLEGDNPVAGVVGPDAHIFRVPGQRILILSCELRGPSYIRNPNSAHSAIMAHGTSFPSLVGVAEIGEIAVNDFRDQGTPCFGFSARGSLVTLSRDALESAATKCASRAKALGGAIVLVECELPRSIPAVEGGNDMMQICCRDAGSVVDTLPMNYEEVADRFLVMSGHDPRASENEVFMRSITHARSSLPRQPWEQPAMLCIFDPWKAAFPQGLNLPYQGVAPASSTPQTAAQPSDSGNPVPSGSHCQAWTRAVKAKRGPRAADRRDEAYRRVLTLLHAFSSFFDLCTLMADDEEDGPDSVQAVLAGKSPNTILKHLGPVRTFCEWLLKASQTPPFAEKVLWSFIHCVLKMPKTAATTLDSSLRAIKWSYYTLGLRVQLEVFSSPRIHGVVKKALQTKNPWCPASPLKVSEVLQLHTICCDPSISVIDRCGAAHFLAMLYARARASDIRCVKRILIDVHNEDWSSGFIELGTLEHKTSRLDTQRRRILPLVIPGQGIAKTPFGQLLLDIRAEAGLPNDQADVPFLPAPLPDGSWSSDPLSSSEITRWLRYLLPRPSTEQAVSSHSLKVTSLVWCSKFGMLRETKRVLGHHSDAATGSDAVYGRELQSAALREYVVVLDAAAAFPQDSEVLEEAVEDDQDEQSFWAHPTSQVLHRTTLGYLAMTSSVDSAPFFVQRADEISLAKRVVDALKGKGVSTLAQLAFCVGQPGQVLSQTEFDTWSEALLVGITVGEKASLRRLILEAQTMLVGVAERNARMDQLRTQLAGWESRCLKYIGPEKCHSREDEVQNVKPLTTSLSLEGGKLKVTEAAGMDDRDIEGSLQVLNALRRRGVAYAFARLISWERHEAYVSSLFRYLTKPAQPGYRKVSLRQILRADKLAFSKLSEAGEDIRADASGILPLDSAIGAILHDYDLIVALLPMGDLDGKGKNANGRGGRPGPYGDAAPWKGKNGKGKGGWTSKGSDYWTGKGKNTWQAKGKSPKGKGSGAGKPEWLPEGLRFQGASAWNHKGNKVCYGFNLGTCSDANCQKGDHTCCIFKCADPPPRPVALALDVEMASSDEPVSGGISVADVATPASLPSGVGVDPASKMVDVDDSPILVEPTVLDPPTMPSASSESFSLEHAGSEGALPSPLVASQDNSPAPQRQEPIRAILQCFAGQARVASALIKQGYFSYGVDRFKQKAAMAPVLQMDLSTRET
ncbi:unnamed protein product, partial [Symbiodinium sp. CCMP2592]